MLFASILCNWVLNQLHFLPFDQFLANVWSNNLDFQIHSFISSVFIVAVIAGIFQMDFVNQVFIDAATFDRYFGIVHVQLLSDVSFDLVVTQPSVSLTLQIIELHN